MTLHYSVTRCQSKGMFTCRRTCPLGRASPSKMTGFHLAFTLKFPGPSGRAGSSMYALQEGQPFMVCLHGKFPALQGEISDSQ